MRTKVFTRDVTGIRTRTTGLLSATAALALLTAWTPAIAAESATFLRDGQGQSVAIQSERSDIIHAHDQHDDVAASLRIGLGLFGVAETASGLRAAFGHTIRNASRSIFFRGSDEAIADRTYLMPLPDSAVLRQSMMHAMSYDTGLRAADSDIASTVSAALRGSYSAREKLEAAQIERARMHGAIAAFLPKVEATLEASSAHRYSVSTGSYDHDTSSASVEVSMPLFTSGVNINSYRQAKHISISADYSYIAEEHKVALEAITAHINLRLNRRIEKTLARNVAAMQRIAAIARRLYEAGDASRTDIAIAQANVESARAELDLARKTREETRADFESVTALTAPHRLELSKPETLVPASLDAAIDTALQNNPTIRAAEHNAVAARHNARAVRGRFGPQITAFGRYDHYLEDSIQEDREDDYSVGVRLKVPLIDFSAVPSISEARHQAAESGYRALDQARRISRQVERQWTAWQSANRRVSIISRQVNSVAASVEGVRREYEAGFRSITDVLNDQVKLARAQITLESARHERILSAYEIAFTTSHDGVRHLASLH